MSKKILLTGSHAGSTAIAVIEEIKSRKLDWEVHWVGMDYKNLKELGIVFHSLESGKIENKFTKNTLINLFRIPIDLFRSCKLVKEIRPNLTFSFGSAAGFMVSFWSSILGIPVILHEQTASAGRANIFTSYFAKKILISREESRKFFNKQKTEVVGNPLNKEIVKYMDKERSLRVKTIFITGGSRGSKWINDAIKPLLPKLLERYFVVHQTGEKNLEEFTNIKKDVDDASLFDKYFAFGQTDPKNMAEILSKSDIVVSRAGANTVWELLALKKPSVLIPIPWSYNDEQTENAKYMKKLGLASILPQGELNPQRLLSEIEILVDEYPKILKKTKDVVSPDINSSEKIVDVLEKNV
jgi:UDP-N-acetylglucosamine--N-acetylmuramyl-(pentapeptide) pyrophosphoryl-undecaprenol N-acetylglucosamine transferase